MNWLCAFCGHSLHGQGWSHSSFRGKIKWMDGTCTWCVLAAHACTNANGQPWTGARFPIGSPHLPIMSITRCSCVLYAFLCAFLWNKRGYIPCPNSAFYSSTSGVKTYQCERSRLLNNLRWSIWSSFTLHTVHIKLTFLQSTASTVSTTWN